MSLNIVTGKPTLNHRAALVKYGQQLLLADAGAETSSLFFIVPDHIKFSEEVALLKEFKRQAKLGQLSATTKVQTFSFSRLAWYFLQNTSFYGTKKLTDAGEILLLKKVLLAKKDELTLLKSQVEAPGFIGQLQRLFKEFAQGAMTLDMFATMAELDTLQTEEQLKLREFYLLYRAYLDELAHLSLKKESPLEVLAAYFLAYPQDKRIFIFYGYDQFSNEERQVIEALLQRQARVILSSPAVAGAPELIDWQKSDRDSLRAFYYQEQLGPEPEVLEAGELLAADAEAEGTGAGDLLGQAWIASLSQSQAPEKNPQVTHYLRVFAAGSVYDEVVGVAQAIKKAVRQGARYQDIALYVRELTVYGQLLRQVFADNEIPVNVITEDAMKDHPLVEFFESLFLVDKNYFRYQDVMRLLKTELLPLGAVPDELDAWQDFQLSWRQKNDQFENILLKNGFSGGDFTRGDWQLLTVPRENSDGLVEDPRYQEQLALQTWSNEVRGKLVDTVQTFFSALKKAENGQAAAKLFFEFLTTSGVKAQLSKFRDAAIAAGDLRLAKNHQQTWQALCQLLDDYVLIFGTAPFSLDIFAEMLQTGLNALTYEQIPQTLDQVEVDKLENVMPVHSAYVFALGLNDETFPTQVQNKTLLTDEEREKIQRGMHGKSPLNFDTKRENQKENLRMYHLLMSATKQLTVSYANQLEKGSAKLSSFVQRMVRQFKLDVGSWQPIEKVEGDVTTLNRLSTYRQLLRDYTALRALPAETVVHPFWQTVPHLLKKSALAPTFNALDTELNKKNIPTTLTPPQVTGLYGQKIGASVSKMESFYQCEYQYFLNYGLRLQERELFELDPRVTGEFFHQVLDEMFKILVTQNKTLGQLNELELTDYIKQTLDLIFVARRYQIFNRNPRMAFIKEKLVAIVKRLFEAMNYQMNHTNSRPVSTEWRFDATATGLKGPKFQLAGGYELNLRGIIDRVDVTYVDETPYLTVVDYKSSKHEFNFSNAYYGLAMQMLTYLEVVLAPENEDFLQKKILTGTTLRQATQFQAAGALYLHVKNPEIKAPVKDVEEEILKAFKYNGIIVNHGKLLTELDPDIASSSLIYPLKNPKAGIKVDPGQSVTPEQIPLLIKMNQNNLITAGEKIVTGKIDLNPRYQREGTDHQACTYCPFRSICRFDVLMPENNYRRLQKLKKEEVFDRVKKADDKNSGTAASEEESR